MAKETRTHLLVVDYDKDQEDIFSTFGSTPKEATDILNIFVDAVNNREPGSFASRMMELVNQGKISGGLLLALATHDISTMLMQRRAQTILGTAIKDLLNQEGDNNFLDGLLGANGEDKPDRPEDD